MKYLTTALRILWILLLVMPVLGSFGIFPPPTAEMYSAPGGWEFISAMMNTGYLMPLLGVTFATGLMLLIMNKTALAAIILAPITINIALFHVFLDATPFTAASSMGWAFVALNVYFLWINKEKYKLLW